MCGAQSITISVKNASACRDSTVKFTAVALGVSSRHYQWQVNGAAVGADNAGYITDSLKNGDAINCLLTTATHSLVATSNTITMTMDTMPYVGMITGVDSEVCVGVTITLSDSVAGGVWTSSGIYTSVINGIVKGLQDGGSFEFNRFPASDTVRYTISNSCGTVGAKKAIQVNPLPDAYFTTYNPLIYTRALCVGGSLQVDYGVSSPWLHFTYGFAYDCYYGICGRSAGTDYVYNIMSNVCGTDSFGMWVTVLPGVNNGTMVISDTELCIGEKLLISELNTTGTPYWYLGDTNTILNYIGTTSISLTGAKAGVSTVCVRGFDQCGNWSASGFCRKIVVKQTPQAVTGPDHVWIDSVIQLSDSTQSGIWKSDSTEIAEVDAASGAVRGIREGQAVISYSGGNSCSTTYTVTVTEYKKETYADHASLFPNPAQNEVIFQQEQLVYATCIITDVAGRTIKTQRLQKGYTIINIEALERGTYYARAIGTGMKKTFEILKE